MHQKPALRIAGRAQEQPAGFADKLAYQAVRRMLRGESAASVARNLGLTQQELSDYRARALGALVLASESAGEKPELIPALELIGRLTEANHMLKEMICGPGRPG